MVIKNQDNKTGHLYTLSEIEGTCKKAARGIGMSWGMAEEAGMVAKIITMFSANGPKSLARYFQWRNFQENQKFFDIQLEDGCWKAASGDFCPLLAGTITSDRAQELLDREITFKQVAVPVVFAAQVFIAARQLDKQLKCSFNKGVAYLSKNGLYISDESFVNLVDLQASDIRVEMVETSFQPNYQLESKGYPVAKADWDYLQSLAAKTYAPDSEESRLSGAGAGLQDND